MQNFWHTEFWNKNVAPYLRWTGSGHGETNTLSVGGLPAGLLDEVLAWRVPCMACGEPMAPIRGRHKRNPEDRRTEKASLYVAVCCPTSTKAGCGRGKVAAEAFAELHKVVK